MLCQVKPACETNRGGGEGGERRKIATNRCRGAPDAENCFNLGAQLQQQYGNKTNALYNWIYSARTAEWNFSLSTTREHSCPSPLRQQYTLARMACVYKCTFLIQAPASSCCSLWSLKPGRGRRSAHLPCCRIITIKNTLIIRITSGAPFIGRKAETVSDFTTGRHSI